MLIFLFIVNLKMTVGRSKRRSFLTLTFLVKALDIIIALFTRERERERSTAVTGNHKLGGLYGSTSPR